MKAVITFTDNPDGNQSINATFDPPLGDGGSTTSRAQFMALKILEALHDSAGAVLENIEGDPL